MAGAERLPGQDIYEGNIRSSQATGIEAIKDIGSGAGGLGAITQMVAGSQDKFSELQANLENMVFQNQGRLGSALNVQGKYEQAAWDWNKKQQWQEKMAEANAYLGAGSQNFQNQLSGLTTELSNSMSLLDDIGLGGGGGESGGEMVDVNQLLSLFSNTISNT